MTDLATASTASPVLDEAALRRPTFRGGEPVILADGQTYFFPKPNVDLRPRFSAGRISSTIPATDLGPDFNDALMAIDEPTEEQAASPYLDRMFQVAAAGLLVNYKLTDDDLTRLLVYRHQDELNVELWNAILGTARGIYSPKPSSATSESDS